MKVDLDEIGDGAVENAVGEITSGTAKEKSEAGGVDSADAAAGDEQPGDDCDDYEGAEGDAGVAGVNEIKTIINNCGGETIRRVRFDPSLGGAVEKDDGEGDPEEAKARRKGHEGEEVKEVKEEEETEQLELMKRPPRV